eukprot:2264213-Amphidinium_carterae.2
MLSVSCLFESDWGHMGNWFERHKGVENSASADKLLKRRSATVPQTHNHSVILRSVAVNRPPYVKCPQRVANILGATRLSFYTSG